MKQTPMKKRRERLKKLGIKRKEYYLTDDEHDYLRSVLRKYREKGL